MTSRKSTSLRDIAAAERAPSDKLAAANFYETVIEIDPDEIDHTTGLRDRFSLQPAGFDALKASIASNGQQQPILVCPRDQHTGKYPIIAGRTRLRIASILGIKLRAIVRPIEGDALLVAQLQENLARAEYTVGDKIGIMVGLKQKSYKQACIAEMMNISATDVSKLLGLYAKLKDLSKTDEFPRALLASKAGRPKWEALVKGLQELPHNSQSPVCRKVINEWQNNLDADPLVLAMAAVKKAIGDPLSATAYRPLESSYEKAKAELLNANFDTRDLCRLKYQGDPYVNALLRKAIEIEQAILKAMVIKRFDALVAEALNSGETVDEGSL